MNSSALLFLVMGWGIILTAAIVSISKIIRMSK